MINDRFFVIDSHCHIYPEKIAAKAVQGTDNFYGVHSHHEGTTSAIINAADDARIDHMVVQSVATTPKQVKSINEFIANKVKSGNGRFTGLGTLHPDSDDIRGDVEHLIELGLHGVKLHPDIQRFKIDDYRCLKIYELCEERGLPILMHTGDSRYDYSNPNRLLPVMKIYTGLTVVGAHFGGFSVWDEAADKLANLDNLYVDCSSSFMFINDKVRVERLFKAYGPDKILFGSDFPMWNPKSELKYLLELNLPDEDLEKILHKNAIEVFKIIL